MAIASESAGKPASQGQQTLRQILTKEPLRYAFKQFLFYPIWGKKKPLSGELAEGPVAKKPLAFCILRYTGEGEIGEAKELWNRLLQFRDSGLETKLIGWDANERKAAVIPGSTTLEIYKLGYAAGLFWAVLFKGEGAVGAAKIFSEAEFNGKKIFSPIALYEIKPEGLETPEARKATQGEVLNVLADAEYKSCELIKAVAKNAGNEEMLQATYLLHKLFLEMGFGRTI